MKRSDVYSIINDERVYQDRKWGTIEDRPKQVGSWITLMRHLVSQAEFQWSTTNGDHSALDQIRKLVAVGVACMEQHGGVPRSAVDFAEQSGFPVSKRTAELHCVQVDLSTRQFEALSRMCDQQELTPSQLLRQAFRFYHDSLQPIAEPTPKLDECPHAGVFRYCNGCVVSPCPVGLDGTGDKGPAN